MDEKLAPLVSMFKKRTENFDKIHRLKAKLDMLLSIEEEHKKSISKPKTSIYYSPQVVYEEGNKTLLLIKKTN